MWRKNFLNWLNPRIFMPRQSTSKCRHFGSQPSLTGHGSRAGCDVNSRNDDSVVRIFTCFCGEGCESSSKNCQPGTLQGGCSNSTNLQEVLCFISYRFYVGMIILKRRNEESDRSISWKRKVQLSERGREPSRSSSICSMLFKPNDFVQRLKFWGRGRHFTDSVA